MLNHKSFGYIFVGAVSRPRLSRQECRSYIKTHLYLCDLALSLGEIALERRHI
jgi:hypothetical protein